MLGVLRVVTGLLFIQHGMQKMFGFPPAAYETGPFVLLSLMGLAAVLELVGGIAILIGFFTRAVAFVLSGQMAVAYFLFHLDGNLTTPLGFYPIVNGGELAIMFCFMFLFLSSLGPGASVSMAALPDRSRDGLLMRALPDQWRRLVTG